MCVTINVLTLIIAKFIIGHYGYYGAKIKRKGVIKNIFYI